MGADMQVTARCPMFLGYQDAGGGQRSCRLLNMSPFLANVRVLPGARIPVSGLARSHGVHSGADGVDGRIC